MKIEIELEWCKTCDGRGNYDKYVPSYDYDGREHRIDCKDCGGVGKIAYTSINDQKCKLKLEVSDDNN